MAADDPTDRARRGFDWNLLHTFVAIVQEGSITRAADRLRLRQPTVSNALRRLEEQLGHRLIERGRGRFEPTEHGAVLYRECQDICGTIGRLQQAMEDSDSELSGHLRIHMASHVVFPPLDDTLADFHARHPKVTLDIEVATSSSVIQAVASKEATLGICLVAERSRNSRTGASSASTSASSAGRAIGCTGAGGWRPRTCAASPSSPSRPTVSRMRCGRWPCCGPGCRCTAASSAPRRTSRRCGA